MLLSLIPLFTTVSCSYFHEQLFSTSILKWIRAFFWSESHFAQCVNSYDTPNHMFQRVVIAIVSAISVAKLLFGTWDTACLLSNHISYGFQPTYVV
jgi:glucan phosphoethanolaminetransferase (alkaline phosphatase superfamily)